MREPRYRRTSWLDPRLEIRASPRAGRGSFARVPIAAGEVVTIWGAVPVTSADMDAYARDGYAVYEIAPGEFIAYAPYDETHPDHFLNHSCDPNLWLVDPVSLAARRAIAAGEEVTADYATWADLDWIAEWTCACGSADCRGRITGRDCRLPELRQRYGDHLAPWVRRSVIG